MKTAITNLATSITGEWREPRASGDSILMDDGKIVEIGTISPSELKNCDVVIDGADATAIPGLIDSQVHNKKIAAQGVWLAKAGFGSVETPYHYAPMAGWAKKCGMITTVHTGGSSIPGSLGISTDHLLAMQPDVSFLL